jgi:hypothetical protein
LKQIGMALDPRTNMPVETLEAQLDKAKAMKDMASAEKYLADADRINKALENDYEMEFTTDGQGNRLAVWFDPSKPGEMQSATVGQTAPQGGGGGGYSGGGYSGGGYGGGGDSASSEDPEVATLANELINSPLNMEEVASTIKDIPFFTDTKKGELFDEVYAARDANARNFQNLKNTELSPGIQTAVYAGMRDTERVQSPQYLGG